jgi:hypothetical protein
MALKTAYPELPLVDKSQLTTVSVLDSVHILLDVTGDECLSRAVYAIMIAESAKTDDKKSFRSAGHFNYAGIQTDGSRWGYSDPIVGRFWKVDVGGNNREFAAFKDNSGFFDFMSNRIKKKGFDGCDGDKWTTTYINSWWAPTAKASYTKGTEKYNDKLAIYKTAMRKFDDAKKTYEKGKYGKGSSGSSTTENTTTDVNTVAVTVPPLPPAPVFDPEKVFTFNVEKTDSLVNKEIGTFSVVKFNVEFAFEDGLDEIPIDDEYVETEFVGLEAIIADLTQKYTPPNNTVDEIDQGNDPERGSDGSTVTYIDGASTGAGGNNDNEKVKSSLKKATDAVGKGGSGKCARYTFNHANNFVKALIGKSLSSGATTPAGGNANQASYHNALVKLGYTKKETVTLTKAELKKTLETASNWDLGDVVAYWGVSTALASKSGVKYGHTQIFTNGVHGSSNKWTSDNFGNFGCAFVYNGYKVDTWKLVILKSPTAGKKIA